MSLQYRNLSDEELLLRVQNNSDKEAQLFLYKRYKHIVLGVLMLYLKEEQEAIKGTEKVFLDLWVEAQKRPIVYFEDWIHNTIKKYLIRYQKQNKVSWSEDLSLENSEWKNKLNLDQYSEKNALAFEQCLNHLSSEDLEWLELFYQENKSIEEIAHIKQINEIMVLDYIQSARRNLKICMHQKLS